MGRVQYCIQGSNVLDSEPGRETVAWDVTEGKGNKASDKVHKEGRAACNPNIGKQGERWEDWGHASVGAG